VEDFMRQTVIICILAMLIAPVPSYGLEPREVFVLVNKNSTRGQEVADHYCKLRHVPSENVIPLDLPLGEEISRKNYEDKLVKPLRVALRYQQRHAKVLLSVWGMPLRVGREEPTEADKTELVEVDKKLDEQRKLVELKRKTIASVEEEIKTLDLPSMRERIPKLKDELSSEERILREIESVERRLRRVESEAAVDSELMLLWWDDYPKARWLINPLYFQVAEINRRMLPPVLMTARLDGLTPDSAKRLVTDAIWAEEHGLKGKAYVDARGIAFDPKTDVSGTAYGGYDESMRELAKLLEDKAKMPVKLEDTPALFLPNSCPDCALYCGWYSVQNYIKCCKFNRGAVAWHLASYEAVSLHNPGSQWCSNLISDGACATLGAVAEPYTIGFPKPAEFFGFLLTGEFTLVEAYSRTIILTSWMTTLIGDPLYNPFAKNKLLKIEDVQPSPKGIRFIAGGG